MRTLDSITFDATTFTFHGDEDGVRIWHTAAGDGIGLYYFPIPPDIPADLASLEDVRSGYRKLMASQGNAIIEVETPMVDGCPAVRTIIKVPQQPHGMIYLGSVTLPFRDFSYVIKVQCEEFGTTGLRDSEVLDELFGTGEVTLDINGGEGRLKGWMQDPYDASIVSTFARNRGEAQEYDARFPEHPLSRLRPTLNHIQDTLHVGDEVSREPRFVYQRTQHQRPWWKFW
jgi:hypothetical protein